MSFRRSFFVAATVSLCTLIVAVIIAMMHEWEWPPNVCEEEFLGAGLLETTEPETDTTTVAREREESEPAVVDGKASTVHRGWYINGNKEYEHTYADHKEHGWQRNWSPAGQLVREEHWTYGYRHGRSARWFTNGQPAEEGEYANARPDGTHRTWYRNGQPYTLVEYRHGLRNGRLTVWHPNGQKSCEASFINDKLDGTWQKWDAEGVVLRRIEYKNGDVVSEPERREPLAYPGVLGSPDFALVFRQGGGLTGFNTLRVSAAGRCDFTYYSMEKHFIGRGKPGPGGTVYNAMVWRRAVFQLDGEMQRQVRDALKNAHVLSLRDEYVNPRIADGTQWVVQMRAADEEKKVFCSNRFPAVLVELSRTLREQILMPHRMEVLTASRIDDEKVAGEWLDDAGR